jgi:hypothetical protein
VLTKDGSHPGKLTLAAADSVIYTLADKTDGTNYSSITSIDASIVTTDISESQVSHSGTKLTKLTGVAAGGTYITAAVAASGTNTISSETATVGS